MRNIPLHSKCALKSRPDFRIGTLLKAAALLIFLTLAFPSLLIAQIVSSEPAPEVIQHLKLGSEAMHQGNAAEAERQFQQAVTAAPQLADGYLGLGLAQLSQFRLDAAVASLTKATELNPQLSGVHMFLGIALYQQGNAESAIANFQQELAAQPKNVEALTWMGIVEISSDQPDKAANALDQAALLAPKDLNILYYRGRAHALTAQKAYQELSRLDPDSWLVHRALGESYSESAQPEKAIAEFQIAIQKQPNDADLYESLGSEEQKISHFDEATKAFQQQLKLNPHSPVALYNLGRIQVEHGHPAEGVALLQQAIANHTTPAPAEFYLGLGLTDLQRYDEAASWLEKVLDHQPSSFIRQSDYYQLARVYQKLGRKQDSDRALAELKRLKSESSPGNQPSQ